MPRTQHPQPLTFLSIEGKDDIIDPLQHDEFMGYLSIQCVLVTDHLR